MRHRDVVPGVGSRGEAAPRRYMKGQNGMWPWYKAAAGSIVHDRLSAARDPGS